MLPSNRFPELVWGEDWTFRIPFGDPDAIYAIAEADNEVPTQVSHEATGLMFTVWELAMGKALTGVTNPVTLGAVHVHYKGYGDYYVGPDPPSYDNVWYQAIDGADFETDTTCKFRIYAGECETLPTAFTREDVLALLNGDAATGPRTSLHYHARNVEIQFPATSTPKYRVLAVPFSVLDTQINPFTPYFTAPEVTVGRTANRLRYADDTDVTLERPYDQFSGGMTNGSGYMLWIVYVLPATTDAFSVFTRALAKNGQNLGSSQSSNVVSPVNNTSPWTVVKTWNRPSGGEIISVTIDHQIAWSGRFRVENLEAVSRTYTLTDTNTVTYTTEAGAIVTLETSNVRANQLFGAFDTFQDGFGASGLTQANQLLNTTYTVLTLTGDQLDLFVNSETVDITLDCVRVVSAVTGGTDNWNDSAKFWQGGTASSVHSTACYVSTYLYLDGPTGDP